MDKTALRREIRAKKQAMTPAEIEKTSALLAEKLRAHPAYQKAKSIYGYLSYNQEVRTLPILQMALADGKGVAVPKVMDGGKTMRFLWLSDLSAIAPGYCGIPEPVADAPEADDETALVLLPGLAFDLEGHRVGYGGGFYDQFLAREKNHPTVSLFYGFQLFDHLDTEVFDIPADYVLTQEVTA